MSATERRDWLAAAIRSSDQSRNGCPDCCCGNTCPEHAAEAVLDACRREELFIMPQRTADALLAGHRQCMREGIAEEIRALMSECRIPVRDAALKLAAETALGYRDEDDAALEDAK